MRIVVIRAGALGDVILTLPALRALRERYPGARIEVVGYPSIWRLAGPLVDSIASIDAPAFASLYTGMLSPDLRNWLQGIDLTIAWSTREIAPLLRDAGAAEVVSASPYPPAGVHAAHWLLATISDRVGPVDRLDFQSLALESEELESGRSLLQRLGLVRPLLLHPGAGADWKRWPAARFAALGNDLVRRGFPVLLIEGPADRKAIAEVQQHAVHPFPVLQNMAPRALASVLAHGAAFAGNDSGVTHLAASLEVPTLALFGPTDPSSWRPLGPARVLRTCQTTTQRQGQIRVCDDDACMQAITVDTAAAELRSLIDPVPFDLADGQVV